MRGWRGGNQPRRIGQNDHSAIVGNDGANRQKQSTGISHEDQDMSSILTNTSAMVALQTMKSINKNMSATQSEISTGKSVANAKDNATV